VQPDEEGDHACYIPKKHLHTWKGHTKGVQVIRFFPNYGHLLLSGSHDSKVKIWDVYNNRACRRTYAGHTATVRDVQFSNDGTRFISASFDRTTKLWDTETGQCIKSFTTGKLANCCQYEEEKKEKSLHESS
jgi:pre-mRNA-processing factor 17